MKDHVIAKLKESLKKNDKRFIFGFPTPRPHPVAVEAYSLALGYQSNISGMHLEDLSKRHVNQFKNLEKEALTEIGEYLGDRNVEGYITSGGTEGNLMGLWLGRNSLKDSADYSDVTLIKTALSHYSIDKSADILNITDILNIELNRDFSMNVDNFIKTIYDQYSKGKRKFIVILTMGNTVTGTYDSFLDIDQSIIDIQNIHTDIQFFVHVDAALGGFILPFLSIEGQVLKLKNVNSIVLDGHKNGMQPYSSGIFLCKRGLLNNIGRKISYTGRNELTFSGSRSGAPAAALWTTIKFFSKEGFVDNAKKAIELKEYFLNLLQEYKIEHVPIKSKNMNLCGVSFGVDGKLILDNELSKKYCLHPTEITNESLNAKRQVYQFAFMHGTKRTQIDEFIKDYLEIYAK